MIGLFSRCLYIDNLMVPSAEMSVKDSDWLIFEFLIVIDWRGRLYLIIQQQLMKEGKDEKGSHSV